MRMKKKRQNEWPKGLINVCALSLPRFLMFVCVKNAKASSKKKRVDHSHAI